MKIMIKENDKLTSKLHDKTISEYLIYLVEDNINIKCYNEIGNEAKKNRVNDLLYTHFINEDWNPKINITGVIEEMNFETFIKQ